MAESKRSRKAKNRLKRAALAFFDDKILCWAHVPSPRSDIRGSHTCQLMDPLHTGPHLCCCGFSWEDT